MQAERHAGRVVQHRDRHVEPRPLARRLRLDQAAHRRDVGAVAAARHRQHAHAERGQPGVLDRPAGLVDQDAVAGAQQGAGDDVEGVGGADGGDDLPGTRGDAVVGELDRQRFAQPQLRRPGRRTAAPSAATCRLEVALRIAAASISGSSHSAGRVPRPGIGLPPGGWNMPRISAVALFGTCCRGGAFATRRFVARRVAPPRRGWRGRRSRDAGAPRPGRGPAAGRRR